jgi:hypothetical protein
MSGPGDNNNLKLGKISDVIDETHIYNSCQTYPVLAFAVLINRDWDLI